VGSFQPFKSFFNSIGPFRSTLLNRTAHFEKELYDGNASLYRENGTSRSRAHSVPG
jgi:hypothetical protein